MRCVYGRWVIIACLTRPLHNFVTYLLHDCDLSIIATEYSFSMYRWRKRLDHVRTSAPAACECFIRMTQTTNHRSLPVTGQPKMSIRRPATNPFTAADRSTILKASAVVRIRPIVRSYEWYVGSRRFRRQKCHFSFVTKCKFRRKATNPEFC